MYSTTTNQGPRDLSDRLQLSSLVATGSNTTSKKVDRRVALENFRLSIEKTPTPQYTFRQQ